MPTPLSVAAATMPAIHVPWPLGSWSASSPSTNDAPGTSLPARSSWVASTPVSRTATVTLAVGVTDPYADVQPILGRAHCSANRASDGSPSAWRVRSSSTALTLGSARSAAMAASSSSVTPARRSTRSSDSIDPPTAPTMPTRSAHPLAVKVTIARSPATGTEAAGALSRGSRMGARETGEFEVWSETALTAKGAANAAQPSQIATSNRRLMHEQNCARLMVRQAPSGRSMGCRRRGR